MITINLSEKQARDLLAAVGWDKEVPRETAAEIFRQLEHKFDRVSDEQAKDAVWMHENGYNSQRIHNWKKDNAK